jgi:hypothetical protein
MVVSAKNGIFCDYEYTAPRFVKNYDRVEVIHRAVFVQDLTTWLIIKDRFQFYNGQYVADPLDYIFTKGYTEVYLKYCELNNKEPDPEIIEQMEFTRIIDNVK